jgi:hypothetical protein
MRKVASKLLKSIRGDPTRLFVDPPNPSADRNGLALVIIVRNEERHIEDWLRFHALAGARAAIIYDNGSTDATAQIVQGFQGLEVIVVPWVTDIRLGQSPLKRQPLAYAHAVCTFGARFRWMGFIDIDEYIVPKTDLSICEALGKLETFSNISLPWTMFGTDGHEAPPDEPAVYAYRRRAAQRRADFTNFKCIVDPCKVTRVSTHKYWTSDMGAATVNDRGEHASNHKERRTEAFASAELLQLNHYFTFSQEELDRKLSRETVSHAAQSDREKFVRKTVAAIEEDTVSDDCAPEFLTRKGIEDWHEFRALGRPSSL